MEDSNIDYRARETIVWTNELIRTWYANYPHDDVLVASEIFGLDLEFASRLPSQVGWVFSVRGLFHAGLSSDDRDETLLYCREDTLALLNALDQMEKAIRVSGPPGIGKSVTIWLWACHRARVYDKSVLWVHIRKGADAQVLMVSGNQVRMAALRLDQMPPLIRSNQADIVIVDGVTCDPMHEICIGAVFNWTYNRERRAVSVASMARKTNDEDDESFGVSLFDELPWPYGEYLDAIADAKFFAQVEPMMLETTQSAKGSGRPEDERVELLNNKFYYAGNSARWMWATSLASVVGKTARLPQCKTL